MNGMICKGLEMKQKTYETDMAEKMFRPNLVQVVMKHQFKGRPGDSDH